MTPTQAPKTAPTHPIARRILSELCLEDAEVLLPAARFDFWAEELPRRHPRAEHPVLYGHLLAIALRLAPKKVPAAAQLYVLSTLGGRA